MLPTMVGSLGPFLPGRLVQALQEHDLAQREQRFSELTLAVLVMLTCIEPQRYGNCLAEEDFNLVGNFHGSVTRLSAVQYLTLAFHLISVPGWEAGTGASAISKSISCWKVTGSCRGHSVFSCEGFSACS